MKIFTGGARSLRALTPLRVASAFASAGACAFAIAMTLPTPVAAQAIQQSSQQPPKGKVVPLSEEAKKQLPKTLPVPTTFEGLFAERDSRAVRALGYLRCLTGTLTAMQRGMVGNVPRSWLMVCVEEGGEWRSVFSEPSEDASSIFVRMQFSLKTGRVVTGAIDTVRVASATRAMIRALQAPLPGGGRYEYMPVILPQPTFVEIWFLPVPSSPARVVVGGDSLIQMNQDGTRELGHTSVAPSIRTFSLQPQSGPLVIESREGRLPLLSELMIARVALTGASEVHLRTAEYESRFRRGDSSATHVRR